MGLYVAKTSSAKTDSPDDTSNTSPSPFIDDQTAVDAYDESRKWLRVYFDPIDELERIARNKPSSKIDANLPRVTDGTMAAIVQEQPKRIIQQVATGIVECKDYPEYAQIASYMLTNRLIPLYSRMGNALQKQWNMLSKAMTYGRSTSYTFFTKTDGQLHVDFNIPYVKDVLTEKGKVFGNDSNISFMRSWYQDRDIKGIINREQAFAAKNKGYKSEWDLKALSSFLAAGSSAKPADLQTPAEKEKGGESGGFEVIHAFQKGVGAEFYSFSPHFDKGKALRTKKNKDPRGYIPLDHLYCNIDLSNPLGRGQIELSGGIQNLIDQQMQMFQFMTTLMMGPPLQVWGDVDQSTVKFRPNAIWDMGQNQNNLIKPVDLNNFAIQNFPNNYGLLKSQILNLNSSQDHSVSAESGNPAQSKTQAGVQASEARLGVSDNYLRKQFESWWGAESETAINIYFAEMTGKVDVKLEGEDLKEFMRTDAKKYIDKKGVLTVPFSDINHCVFRFKVDASTSEIKEDLDNADKLTEALKIIQSSQNPTVRNAEVKVTKLLLDEIGAEGTDDLFPEATDQNGQPTQQPQNDPNAIMQQIAPMVQQMVAEAVQQGKQAQQEDPTLQLIKALGLKFNDLPEQARQIVLAHTGLQSDQATPAAENQQLEISKTAHQHGLEFHNATQPEQPQTPTGQPGQAQPAQDQGQSQPAPQDQPQPDHPLDQNEQQLATVLFHRGFSETDVEQAIVMLRQGIPLEQIIQTLGGKYAPAQ